jgi:RHS repeat-associated protein
VNAVRVVTSPGDDGEVTFTFGDHLGSSSTIWEAGDLGDTDPGVRSFQRYYPYGEPRDVYSPALPTDHTFTGQISDGLLDDGGTGLMYYGARYYDPQVGRFAAADTIVPNPGNPQDLNRYTYVGNNPVNFTDPSGHVPPSVRVPRPIARKLFWATTARILTEEEGRQPVEAWELSEKGEADLKYLESFSARPYNDCSTRADGTVACQCAIGWGNMLHEGPCTDWELNPDNPEYPWPDEDYQALFEEDLDEVTSRMGGTITAWLTQEQYDALVMRLYNTGAGGLTGTNLAALVNTFTIVDERMEWSLEVYHDLETEWVDPAWWKLTFFTEESAGLEKRVEFEFNRFMESYSS